MKLATPGLTQRYFDDKNYWQLAKKIILVMLKIFYLV